MRHTNIRPFHKGDIGLLYAEYQNGDMDLPSGMGSDQFLRHVQAILVDYDSHWIVEDTGKAIAMISIKSNGWMIEPHVDTFLSASKQAIFRGYIKFMEQIAEMAGSCLIRTLSDTKHVFERLVRREMLLYVGEIPDGDSRGTVYLYCKKPGECK